MDGDRNVDVYTALIKSRVCEGKALTFFVHFAYVSTSGCTRDTCSLYACKCVCAHICVRVCVCVCVYYTELAQKCNKDAHHDAGSECLPRSI